MDFGVSTLFGHSSDRRYQLNWTPITPDPLLCSLPSNLSRTQVGPTKCNPPPIPRVASSRHHSVVPEWSLRTKPGRTTARHNTCVSAVLLRASHSQWLHAMYNMDFWVSAYYSHRQSTTPHKCERWDPKLDWKSSVTPAILTDPPNSNSPRLLIY
jgi:hypothetical protein